MTHQVSANYTMPTILNSLTPAAKPAASKATAADSTGSSSTSNSSGTNLSTTFMTLLAQELQNQDPTAPVDPTQMVGQMISLNQLEQLISINQTISGSSTGNSATGKSQPGNSHANDAQANASAIANAVQAAANGTNSGASSPWAPAVSAASQLPFDPNTMMPLNSASSSAAAASANSFINPAMMGFSGTNNNTSGGK